MSGTRQKNLQNPNEAIIRDNLAKNLCVLEDGLKLRDINVEVQNPDGAAGFIDIFAEDRCGHKVVIELKRSDQAARQGLNEIFKYAGLLQRHYGLRPSDFRVLVVSTTWHELLVPFSECLKDLAFPAEGFQIWIDDAGKVTRAKRVEALPEAHLLDFIPHHMVYTFSDSVTRNGCLTDLKAKIVNLGAADFVLFCLDYRGAKDLPFPHAVYACLGTVHEETITSILGKAGVLKEVEEWRNRSEEDDFSFWQRQFEQHVFGNFAIANACGESGFPESAEALSREWRLGAVVRHGRWEGTEAVHNDVELWRSVARLDRGNFHSFEKRSSPRFRAEWADLVENAKGALLGYSPWRVVLDLYLKEIAVAFPKADVEICIYNPCDLLLALYYVAANGDPGFIPTFRIEVWEGEQRKRFVFSSLVWDGQTRPSEAGKVISGIFDEPFGYFADRSSGLLDKTFTPLLSAHGFSMPVIETEWSAAPEPRVTKIEAQSGRIVRTRWSPRPVGESFSRFFRENREYLRSLVRFFNKHSVGLVS